ncbi:hypothetical protein [Mycobacterium sp.]|uniref:hypothetical protein n=1 Tax=Mycobacterium sp. TaxID=1785 RepID=UPI0025E98EC6|nr:hypothetical protein [Mycobacterium sp.]MBW0012522.1 hypothetical protein [Mycobacterium sp.]
MATEDEKVDDWAASDLAWELAEAISPLLANRDRERDRLYAAIGSGDSYAAIDAVLQILAGQGSALPAGLVAKLTNWLDAYTHSDDAHRLQELLRVITAVR